MSVVILTPEQRAALLATLRRDYNYRAVLERLTWRKYLAWRGRLLLNTAHENARWGAVNAAPWGARTHSTGWCRWPYDARPADPHQQQAPSAPGSSPGAPDAEETPT